MGGHHHNHSPNCDHGHDHGHDHGKAPGHSHSHTHSHAGSHDACHGNAGRKQLGWAAVLTGLFMIAEVVGGLISGSLALLADAGHMLTDFAALSMAWAAFLLATRPATSKLTFGYARLPVLAAFVNGLALFVIAALIINEAFHRYGNIEEHSVLAGPMLWVAIGGLLVNALVFRILWGADRDNLNVRGAILHVIGDMLGSVAAIIAALVIMRTGYMAIDPILSVVVALLILRSAWYLVKDAGHILLEGAPKAMDTDAIRADLTHAIDGISEIKNMHLWSLTDGRPMMTLEIQASETADRSKMLENIRRRLSHDHGVADATIEIK